MQIAANKVVTLEYTLSDPEGEVLDTSKGREPLAYIHGTQGIIPGLETALEGKTTGDTLQVTVPPEEGYGDRNEALVFDVPRDRFQGVNDVEVGMQFRVPSELGPRLITVVGVEENEVKVDANHPLAGKTLVFDVDIVGVRDATKEELEHGHVHAPGEESHGGSEG
jgi:FKBP-type peptidyl-prolyl cis-trans isomerase SlyD